MKKADVTIVILVAAVLSAGADEGPFRRLSLADYRDKMEGAWIGQSVGVAYGAPTEFKYRGELAPEEKLPVWSPGLINGTFWQDDLYVEMTFLETLEKYGIDVDVRQAGIEFANSRYRLWCANNNARNNIRKGIAAPWSSDPKYHPSTDDIDYQIEADFSGIISPGMPARVRKLADQFGRIMNYGDGLYAGIFVGALYAEAFFSSNRVAIVQTALESIPAESKYAEMVRDMLRWYAEMPRDWKAAWRKVVDKWQAKENLGRITFPGIDVKTNGAMVLLGYLWGEGDPDRTMQISTAGGYDSDCNPSSACGVLFTSLGASAVPSRFKSELSRTNTWEYTSYDFPKLLATCEQLTRKLVIAEGGRIEGNDLLIRNDGPHLSAEEMKRIRYAPAKEGEQSEAKK